MKSTIYLLARHSYPFPSGYMDQDMYQIFSFILKELCIIYSSSEIATKKRVPSRTIIQHLYYLALSSLNSSLIFGIQLNINITVFHHLGYIFEYVYMSMYTIVYIYSIFTIYVEQQTVQQTPEAHLNWSDYYQTSVIEILYFVFCS